MVRIAGIQPVLFLIPGNNSQVSLILQDGGYQPCTLYIDDVSLVASGSTNNVLANADFEDGAYQTAWTVQSPFLITDPPARTKATLTLEGEKQAWAVSGGAPTVTVVTETGANANRWAKDTATGVNQAIQFTTRVYAGSNYSFQWKTKKYNAAGTIQVLVDGTNLGTAQNLYNSTTQWATITLGTKNLLAGNHTIQFKVTGKSTSSSGYQIPVDTMILTPQ